MSIVDTVRRECERRLSIGQDAIYLTLTRDALPAVNPRLLGKKGPVALEVCNVIPDEAGGYRVTCIFKASAILRFLEKQLTTPVWPRN